MSARLRVLHAIQNLNYGGMERLLADMVERLDHGRFESHVLALGYLGRFAEGLERHATLHVAAPMPPYSMLWPSGLARQVREIAPDVVHTHSGVWYKVSLAARWARARRLIHTEHGRGKPDPWQARLVDHLASRRTDVVVAVSEVLADQLRETVVSDPARIRLIHNGVDTERYQPRADNGIARRELGIPPEVPVIGSVGRLEPIKGYDLMVEAFALLHRSWQHGPAPVLVIGGEGSQRPQLERMIQERNLAGTIHILGWRDDIHDLHSCFSFFTMSSRSEGTSVSLLEAMSAGLCPIVTDVGGNAAVLGDQLRHRLVGATQPEPLAAAWRAALSDPSACRADGRLARERVQTTFALDFMIRAYEKLYLGEDERE